MKYKKNDIVWVECPSNRDVCCVTYGYIGPVRINRIEESDFYPYWVKFPFAINEDMKHLKELYCNIKERWIKHEL